MNASTNVSSLSCDIWRNPTFVFGQIFLIFSAGFCFFFNAILLYFLQHSQILHPNLLCLLVAVSVAFCCTGLYHFLNSLISVIVNPITNCAYVPRFLSCVWQETGYIIFGSAIVLSLLLISIERAIAVSKHGTYDSLKSEKRNLCVRFIYLACMFLPGIISHGHNMISVYPNERVTVRLPYCSITLYQVAAGKAQSFNEQFTSLVLVLIIDAVGVGLYLFTWYRCRYKLADFTINQAHAKLASRWQLRHTVEIVHGMNCYLQALIQ